MLKYLKNKFKKAVLYLIEKIEVYEYKNFDLDEDDITKKIINTLSTHGKWEIETDTGYHPVSDVHLTQPYKIWKIQTESGKILEGADNHIVFDSLMNEVFIRDLKLNDFIQTKDGLEKIITISKSKNKISMFDLTVDSQDHRYYTNDILSHNTITSGIFLAWYLCFHFDRNILIVANKQATAGEIVSKIKEIVKNLPFFLKPGVVSGGALGLSFDNGCRLFSQATTKTAAIGYTIHLLYADEFAHIQENYVVPFYRSIYPTLSSSKVSKIVITSTPNGINLFHKIYKGAVEKTNRYNPIRIDWWEVPGRDEEWKAQEIANLGSPELFEQEYGNKFLASSTMLLDAKIVEFTARIVKPYAWKELHDVKLENDQYTHLKWFPSFDPNKIWDNSDRFVLSIDLADGVGRDYTVINIFKLTPFSIARIRKSKTIKDESDFFSLVQVGAFHSNTNAIEEVADVLDMLLFDVFGPERTTTIVEMNFKGNYFVEKLAKNSEFYPELLLHSKHSLKATNESMGVRYNKDNKQTFTRELKNLMNDKRIVITSEETFEELTQFGLNEKGSYSGQGSHDDLAMSCVSLISYFDSYDFYEHVEDTIDTVQENIHKAMYKKLEDIDNDNDYIDTIRWLGSQ